MITCCSPLAAKTAEKDNSTTLALLGDPFDDEVDFVEVYQRPVYVIHNLSQKPYSLLRLGYPEGDEHYDLEYPNEAEVAGDLPLHKHYHSGYFEDDDFFELNNQTKGFQQLMQNYTFVLRHTGSRWYGKHYILVAL